VTFVAFKAIDSALSGQNGRFDSDTLPPINSIGRAPHAKERSLASMSEPRLFRVIVPVSDIELAAAFYSAILNPTGVRVSSGRDYFKCGEVILACFDPRADGDPWDAAPNPDHIYFSVDDLEESFLRVQTVVHAGLLGGEARDAETRNHCDR
jgi:predicted enzyme related to lactoylglutathione lyase